MGDVPSVGITAREEDTTGLDAILKPLYLDTFYDQVFRYAHQIAMIVSAAFSVVVFVFLLLAADAFRRCDSPFEDRVIRRMNVFAWVLLANALFNLLISINL